MIAHRLRLSNMVGYLLAGVLCGPFTPGFVADQALAAELAELGVILLMFGVGLHFSVKDLLSVKYIAIPGAILQIVLATLLGAVAGKLFGWSWSIGLVFGLSLSTASTVVLLRALESKGLLLKREGQIAIGWLIVEDLVMVLALVLLPVLAPSEHADSSVNLWLQLAITLGKVFAFILFMFVIGSSFATHMID
jgi:CPA2 family monovalent cation:H+ antiporter-2